MAESVARAAPKPTVTPQRGPAAGKKPGAAGPVAAPGAGGGLGMLYNAGPALGLAPAVQCKVVIGPPNDPFEREADRVAERVITGRQAPAITRLPASGLGALSQRPVSDGLPAAPAAVAAPRSVQRQVEEDEQAAQTWAVQRQAEEEEEPAQTLAIQRQAAAEEEEEPAQTLAIQRAVAEDQDEPAQTWAVQRQAEEEEPAQTLAVQREATEDEEEPAQMLAVQRTAAEDEEEPAQTWAVQRQAEDEEKPVQPQRHGFGGPAMAAAAAQAIHSRSAGDPLLATTRATMERSLGVDLGDVRIHATGGAHAATRALRARAFTHRNHIWLGPGESQADLKLMAHETAHVLQQDGIVRRKPAQTGSAPDEERLPDSLTNGAPAVSPAKPAAVLPGQPAARAQSANGTRPAQPAAPSAVEPAASATELPPETEPAAATETPPVPFDAEAAAGAATPPAEAAPNAPAAPPGAPAKPAAAAEAEAPQRSPASPREDPAFQQTLGQIKKTRKAQASHAPAGQKVEEVTAAAVLPEGEQETRNAESDHLADMTATAEATEQKEDSTPSFTPESFKELLKSNLAELEQKLPQSESEAEDFKRDKPLEGVKQNIGGQVATENAKITGPMAAQVKQDAPPSDQPVETPQELADEPAGDAPRPISPSAAAPKPMLDSEISMAQESQSLDDKMAEEGITEEQLADSNEPTFVEALDTKRQAQQEAEAVPGRYREQETAALAGARGRAKAAGAAGFGAMVASRGQAFTDVFGKQGGVETADKSEQKRILGELERIYNATKGDVDTTLNELTAGVDSLFEAEANAAKETFEKRVEDQLDDIYGITVIDDWIFGEDTEAIEEVFRVEKERFLLAMDGTLDRIAELIAAKLNAAIDRIKQGRKEADDFYHGLSDEQQRLANEGMEYFSAQYDTLEETVTAKQEELAQSLAQSYKNNVDALRESFDKIKEDVSRGWIGRAIDFIVDVATAIKKLGELLLSIISRIANLIGDILAHPIRFLENLAAGVAAGFSKFVGNLDTYLISGFFEWLRGSVGGAAIEVPSSFEPAGLFKLVTQVLSLDYQTFRELAVDKFGEPTVAVLETGAEVAAEGLALFRIAKENGLGALWEHIKEMVTSNIAEIFEQVKQTVLYETIEKVLAFVGSLFTPVGAFIRAVQTLYRGLRFLVDNIDRIAELVDAFLGSLELAVQGNVSAIADKVVLALRNFIVIAIDFLAKLVGLGNLGEKVRKILKAIRQPVVRAMKWLLNKLSPLVRGIKRVAKTIAKKGKAAVERFLEWWRIRERFKQGGQSHTLYFKGSRNSAVLVMHSSQEQVVSDWLVARREAASPGMRPLVEEALAAYARFNVARGNLETLRGELELLPAADRTARRVEYETVRRIFAAALRDLGRTFTALPVEATPERIVLRLPPQKSRALYQQHARSGRLQHSLQRPRRQTNQLQRWEQHARTEITHEWLDYGRLLELPEERILRPDWDRRGARVGMQVDHRIEWQVRPLGDESSLDEPWNYELLDEASNRASGAAIDANIQAERQRIARETGDQSWLARDLTFTQVEGGGSQGRRWSLEEIANGEHLKVYNRLIYAPLRGAPPASARLPSAEAAVEDRSDEGRGAEGLGERAKADMALRSLERRNPTRSANLRKLVNLRLQERTWDDIRAELGVTQAELGRLRDLLTTAGIAV